MRPAEEQHDIVIVGGGICGLATALALHRKGMKSLVLEKSEKLRAEGSAIGIWANGWRALDQLMVGMELRQKAAPITEIRVTTNKVQITSCRDVELRCLKRSDLIETMADKLPPESIRFGCQVTAVKVDPATCFPVLHTNNGIIRTKVLIGCDGSNSVVARSLQLKDTTSFPIVVVRGFTSYQTPHSFGDHFPQLIFNDATMGIIPINDKLIHWYVGRTCPTEDNFSRDDHKHIKELALESVRGFYPEEMVEVVEQGDLDSVSISHIRYQHPWHLLTAKLSNGLMTVAGDAMHVMGPFIGQGGAAGLEDAVVLARCLAQEMTPGGLDDATSNLHERAEAALRKYIKERRMRVLRLSIQTYLMGLSTTTQSSIIRVICAVILMAFFGGLGHTQYNCGRL